MKFFRSLALLGVLLGSIFAVSPAIAMAASGSSDQACQAIQAVNPSGTCEGKANSRSSLLTVLQTVLQVISIIAGVIAVIMIIISGLKYITSSGDAASAASARNTLIYAIVGLVVVAFAQLIVKFVLVKVK